VADTQDKTIIEVVGTIAFLACLYIFYYYAPWPQYMNRRTIEEMGLTTCPKLEHVPEPLIDKRLSTAYRTTVSKFGYAFQIPWIDIKEIRDGKYISTVNLKSGIGIAFHNPAEQLDIAKFHRESSAHSGNQASLHLFGTETIRSNYDWMHATLNTTPDQVSIYQSRHDTLRSFILLVDKSTNIDCKSHLSGEIYSIDLAKYHGFQIGDPSTDDTVDIKLFDEKDRIIQFWIFSRPSKDILVTQSDINVIIQSLHPTTEPNTVIKK